MIHRPTRPIVCVALAATLGHLSASTTATPTALSCSTDEDCSLNGVCTAGTCVCDPGWTTLDEGVGGAATPACGYLDFLPSPISECGPACAFHGGEGGVDKTTTSWGGSVLKNPSDNMYWMFAAEMANKCTLGQWTTNSQVVTAVSKTPMGPFVRQALAIPPWSHNPEAVQTPDGTWVIYTLGPGFGKKPQKQCGGNASSATHGNTPSHADTGHDAHQALSDDTSVNFTLHSATSPHGPWTPTTLVPIGWNSTWTLQNPGNWNPAPVVLPDGSVRVMAHTSWAPWAGEVILEAPSWKGPYRVVGSDLIDNCSYCEEDPFMWKDHRGNWHVLYHRMFDPTGPLDPHWGNEDGSWQRPKSPIPSPGWAGGHAFSRDGLTWSAWSRCYNTSVTLTDGTTLELLRRERPKLLMDDNGRPTHLFNGVNAPPTAGAGRDSDADAQGVDGGDKESFTYTIVAPLNVPANR